MTPEEVARRLERAAGRMDGQAQAALAAAAERLRIIAVSYSLGPYPQAELTRRGHPYARRHGRPRLDPNVVNVQTGAFAGSWRTEGPARAGDGWEARVFNTDPKAPLLEDGTRYMFARRPHVKTAETGRGLVAQRIAEGIDAALRG